MGHRAFVRKGRIMCRRFPVGKMQHRCRRPAGVFQGTRPSAIVHRVPITLAECFLLWPRRRAMTSTLYHEGNRAFQDQFDSRRLADRLEQKLSRAEFSDDDRKFVESCSYFFIATADAAGRPDCSFKGGAPGFVRVTGPSELAFPDYDGNGMFKSLGNLAVNPHVGLLFIAMHGSPKRLRINGSARIGHADPLLAET